MVAVNTYYHQGSFTVGGVVEPGEGTGLTVGQRILLHLADHPTKEFYEVPPELTQQGLAVAAGIERRHVPQYVRHSPRGNRAPYLSHQRLA